MGAATFMSFQCGQCDINVALPYYCIRHFCHARHLFYIMHADDVCAAHDSHSDCGGGAFHALVGGQVKCKANE
jgi:hypothetical protein